PFRGGQSCAGLLAAQLLPIAACGAAQEHRDAMLSSLFNNTTIPALGQVLNFAQARHTVLTGNIANVNTPGYRLRDLSQTEFQERLKEAITASRTAGEPVSPGQILGER